MKAKTLALVYWFAFLFLLLFMTSCAPKKSFTTSETVKDSIYVNKTVKPFDTLVSIPGNKVHIGVSLDDLIPGKTFKNTNKNLTASLRREGNTIIADCDQEKNEMIITLQRELIESYRLREVDRQKAETITIPETPWYLVPLVWIGGVTLIILLVYIAWRIIKFYINPKKV